MNNYIGAKLENLPVKYGFYDLGPVRDLAVGSFGYVLNDLFNLRNDFVSLGFHLREIREFEYYRDFGYLDFYEFCECNFNLKKSSVCNYIRILETFGVWDGVVLSNRLDKKFLDYSYTQLVELSSISPEQWKNYPSSMSVSEMKAWKRTQDNIAKKIAEDSSVQSIGQDFPKKSYLSVSDLCNLKGIVLQNKIKKVDSLCQKKIVIYDENGKELHCYNCDLLLNGNSELRFRIRK